MNVAYFLVGTAWLAGQTPAAPTNPPAGTTAPVVAPGYGGGYGGGCGCGGGCGGGFDGGCGCDTGCGRGHHFRNKMRGLFSRGGHGSSGCCDTCGTTYAAPVSSCCSAPVTTGCCDTGCSSGHGHRLRGLFRRGGHGSSGCDCGCAPPCGDCGGCGAGYNGFGGAPGAARTGEQIPPPKDGNPGNPMPNKDNKDEKGNETPARTGPGQVQINVAPAAPIPAAAPALEAAPAVGPAPAANEERPF